MAAATQVMVETSPETHPHVPKRTTMKALAESPALNSIPSNYSYTTNPNEFDASDQDETLPTIDFSFLTSGDSHQRAIVIQDLNKACQECGFFMLMNHGVSESLMKAVLDGCKQFFNLPMEENMEFSGKDIWKPIRFGTGVDVKVLSNGKYKNIMHRAVVNNKATRISMAVPHGLSLDTVISLTLELVENESRLAAYLPMKYKDCMMSLQLDGKPCLDHIQLPVTYFES